MIDEKKLANSTMSEEELDNVAGGAELDPEAQKKLGNFLYKFGKILSGTGEDIKPLKDAPEELLNEKN